MTLCATLARDLDFSRRRDALRLVRCHSFVERAVLHFEHPGSVPGLSSSRLMVPWLACTGETLWALYPYGESAGSDPFVIEHVGRRPDLARVIGTK